MGYKVLSSSPSYGFYVSEPTEYLENHGFEVELVPQGTKLTEKDLIAIGSRYDALITGFDNLNKTVINSFDRIKVLAKHGAGIDNIDLKTATEKGIGVVSAPGTNADAVADLTMGLILSMARDIPRADRLVKAEEWPRVIGHQVSEKTVGILGLGLIGKKVAARAAGFGMNILAFDVMRDEEFAKKMNLSYLPIDDILKQADYITIHVPLNATTRNLISKKELESVKQGAFLVNISRGGSGGRGSFIPGLKERASRRGGLGCIFNRTAQGKPLAYA